MKRYLSICVLIVLPVLILCTCTINVPGIGFFSVSFTDTDMGSGEIAGTLTITPSETEFEVSHFTVYWGSSEAEKLAGSELIAEIAITGAVIEYDIAENTAIPSGAGHLLIYAKNETGESETAVSVSNFDKGSTVTVSFTTGTQNFSSYELTASGAGMDTITQTVSGTESSVVIEVPDGTARVFSVTSTVDPSDPGVFLELSGTNTADLSAGTAASVTVNIDQIEEMKIVIPDWYNQRIVQIDNMAGDNWTEIIYSDIGFPGADLLPYDIDFDSDGKIYFANNYSSTGPTSVYVLDNITDSSATKLLERGTGIKSLAVDEIDEVVYFTDGSGLWKCDLDGSNDASLSLASTTVNYIRGMDVDANGILYLVGSEDTTFDPAIFKYDPSTETETAKNAYVELDTPWDVIVKGSAVYVTNYEGVDNYQIIEFDTALTFVEGLGNPSAMPPSGPESTDFYGPHRFVAIPARKIRLIDENDNFGSNDPERIVSFDDITGVNWETFNPSDVGESAFDFFSMY